MKTPLSQVGRTVARTGNGALCQVLDDAFARADPVGPALQEFTHPFHAYPARIHPALVRLLIERFSSAGETVLDPFCGSGTCPVEAMACGRTAVGTDLNPFALQIARVKTALVDKSTRSTFLNVARQVAEHSAELVASRHPSQAPIPKREVHWYDGHILRELAGIWNTLDELPDDGHRDALRMVFSSLVVKCSRQTSHTQQRVVQKRLRKGLPTEFFVAKAEELAHGWAKLHDRASRPARLFCQDARGLMADRALTKPADLVVTSPPYAGTYDYARHQDRQLPWFRMTLSRFRRDEMGARRDQAGPHAKHRWETDLHGSLEALRRVTHSHSRIVVLMGDGVINGRPWDAAEGVQRAAQQVGLETLAVVSQERPDPKHRRHEHLLALQHA